MSHIDRFLTVVKSSGLTLNLLKWEFAKREVKFVGQYVGSGWRRPDPDKFKAIRDMQHIVVYSDHNPLTYVVECALKSARLTRWSLALAQYQSELRYKKGVHNTAADCLSRL